MDSCVSSLITWFLHNGMIVNPDKTEIMAIGTSVQLKKLNSGGGVSVAGTVIAPSNKVKIIGVTLDKALNFDQHITEVCRSCNFHLRALRHIRPSLTMDAANTLACSIVASRLDYCNSILLGLSDYNISRLQRIQNNLARVVCRSPARSNANSLLQRLHWLPVAQRIKYKTGVLTYTAINTGSPAYLAELLTKPQSSRTLRSSADTMRLTVPQTKTATAARAFRAAAPKMWNELSLATRSAPVLESFKRQLKTELFVSAFLS